MDYPRIVLTGPEHSTEEIKVDSKNIINIDPTHLYLRKDGKLKGRSIFLVSIYDWVIAKDDLGQLCLVALEKGAHENHNQQ